MVDRDVLWARAVRGEEYIRVLAESFDKPWLNLYEHFLQANRPLTLGFALIHPDHYSHVEPRENIQGARQFETEIAQGNPRCFAERLWGSSCPVRIEGITCGDHIFPYGYGGPTVASNKMLLCSMHNLMKSVDIHVYPWEAGEPAWLGATLESIRRVLTRRVPAG